MGGKLLGYFVGDRIVVQYFYEYEILLQIYQILTWKKLF